MAICKSQTSLPLLQWGRHGLSGKEGLERRTRLRKMKGEGSGVLEYPQSEGELLGHSGRGENGTHTAITFAGPHWEQGDLGCRTEVGARIWGLLNGS